MDIKSLLNEINNETLDDSVSDSSAVSPDEDIEKIACGLEKLAEDLSSINASVADSVITEEESDESGEEGESEAKTASVDDVKAALIEKLLAHEGLVDTLTKNLSNEDSKEGE